ncbi:MAG TPA: dolichyl-phosphate beta-glucosyltransferase [Terriglobales bacterium]|nr:dolichyl-phosphate beta-glucosyltransferase [Terriglobales bacterium]
MDPLTYSIVIPAYNESERITASLDKILAFITDQHWQAEIVVVNDGSRDNTSQIVREYAKHHPAVKLIENPGNRGKGYTVRNGMMHAHGDVLLFTDADLSSPITEAPKLLAALENGADISFGSRWLQAELQTERQPFHRQVFGRIFNLLLWIILGLNYKDTQCGFKAFTRKAAQVVFPKQRIERWGFDPELLYLARRANLKVKEVPVEWAHDDRSKINPVTDGFKMFVELLKIRWAGVTGKYDRGAPAYAATKTTGISK